MVEDLTVIVTIKAPWNELDALEGDKFAQRIYRLVQRQREELASAMRIAAASALDGCSDDEIKELIAS